MLLKVAIVGSGTVGQATGMGFINRGNQVTFHDINKDKLLSLKNKGFDTSDNLEKTISNADVVFVCVPTPTVQEKIDFSYILECTEKIADSAQEFKKVFSYYLSEYNPSTND